jgi:hypothetical protein
MKRLIVAVAILGAASVLGGCVSANDIAMKYGVRPQLAVDFRNVQTRRYETRDEHALLSAATQVMQDLGFTISESNVEVGLVGGSKHRDAEETGQVAGQVALTIMFALMGSAYQPQWDKEQTIRATVVLTPVTGAKLTDVRIGFDRLLTNNHGVAWRAELIQEAEIYQEFFDKFSQAVFLEGQSI